MAKAGALEIDRLQDHQEDKENSTPLFYKRNIKLALGISGSIPSVKLYFHEYSAVVIPSLLCMQKS